MRIFYFFFSLVIPLTVFTQQVFADSQLCPRGTAGASFNTLCSSQYSPNSSGTIPILSQVLTIILVVAVITALFFLLLGGFRWITSGGDKAKLDQARSTLTSAIIGLILTFLAFFIINVIMFIFTGASNLDLRLPSLAIPSGA